MIYKPTLAYRVWSDDNNVWAEDKSYICPMGTLYFWERDYIEPARGNYTIEQCTGQKDKNGKMIYEGDILRGEETGDYGETLSIWHGVVMLNEEKHRLMIKDDIGDWYELDDFMFEDLAGNIHDNPELLEVAK